MPKISVIMGIYNCENTLRDAIECIFNQSVTDWELIMCDDDSSDETYKIAKKYFNRAPEKIILMKNEKNQGLNYTLNRCLKEARGEFIARMDGDDLCAPDRFQKELEILSQHEEISIVSSDMEFFDDDGTWGRTHVKYKPEPKDFLRCTPFCHAACMVRREAYFEVNGYSVDNKLLRVEDYHLWIKMYERGFRGMNIQEPLYQMRDDRNAQSRKKFKYRLNEAYVKGYAVKHLTLPAWGYAYCMKPIIIGLLPAGLYRVLHRAGR